MTVDNRFATKVLELSSGDVKGDEVKRELTKINNLNEKNKLNNLNNTFQQISKLLTNLEAKNQLVMKGNILMEVNTAMRNIFRLVRNKKYNEQFE